MLLGKIQEEDRDKNKRLLKGPSNEAEFELTSHYCALPVPSRYNQDFASLNIFLVFKIRHLLSFTFSSFLSKRWQDSHESVFLK